MAGALEAIGRSGALRGSAKALVDAAAELRKQKTEEELGATRVPIDGAVPTPVDIAAPAEGAAVPVPTAGGPERAVPGPVDIAAEKRQFEETRRQAEIAESESVQAVEDTPVFKQLAATPTAQNMLVGIAQANGWIQDVGGVQTISNKNLQIAQQIISTDLKLQKDLNEAALNDMSGQVSELEQALLDPKLKEEERAQAQAQLEAARTQRTSVLNHVNVLDREIQRELATRVAKAPAAPKSPFALIATEKFNQKSIAAFEKSITEDNPTGDHSLLKPRPGVLKKIGGSGGGGSKNPLFNAARSEIARLMGPLVPEDVDPSKFTVEGRVSPDLLFSSLNPNNKSLWNLALIGAEKDISQNNTAPATAAINAFDKVRELFTPGLGFLPPIGGIKKAPLRKKAPEPVTSDLTAALEQAFPASQNAGAVKRDTASGKQFRSDGQRWIEEAGEVPAGV